MEKQDSLEPLHDALQHVASACIDEQLLEEAESLLLFLDMARVGSRTAGLLHVWTRCQRGDMREALRRCDLLAELDPSAEDYLPIQAVLRYATGDQNWRSVCDRLVESPTVSANNKRLAASMLDGTFGRNKQAQDSAEEQMPAATEQFDFAIHGSFMRG